MMERLLHEIPKKRKSIREPDKSEDVDKPSDSRCKKCHNWYSFDSSGREKKLKEDEAKELESEKFENNDFICSDCRSGISVESIWESISGILIRDWKPLIIVIVITLFLLFFAILIGFKSPKHTPTITLPERTDSEKWLDEQFDKLENIYNKQDVESWDTFLSGIKSVLRDDPNKPAVFLLAFDNELAGQTAECLATRVSGLASQYLMNKTISPVRFLDYNIGAVKDKGELIPMFQEPVKSHGTMIVSNLQDIKPTLAEAFHYFCDRFSPAVEKAVYFFTLKVGGFNNKIAQKDAEHALEHLWSNHMKENIFRPLLTRLTQNTLKIVTDNTDC